MADYSFWQSIDGRWQQLKRWTLQKVAGTPLGAVAGAIWYDTDKGLPQWHDGARARNFTSYVSSGVSSSPGPEWTAAGGASVTMAACKCRLYDNADFLGEPKEYDIPAKTLTLTDGADQMCVVHYNAGSPEYAIVDAWDASAYNLSNVVPVYRFWYAFGDIHSASVDSLGLGLTEKQALRIGQTDYYKRIGGVGLEPSLSGLTLSVSSAGVWAGPVQMAIADFASSTDSMEYIYKTAAGAWVSVDVTAIPNTLYNPSTGLATLSNSSKWTALYIYRTIGDAKECYIVLDTAEYNSETSATDSEPRADVPRIIQSHCVLVGRILIQKDATTGTVESAWRTAFGTGGGVSTHNDLSGLQGGETGYYGHLTAAQQGQLPKLALGTCTTARATVAKVVELANYVLTQGDTIEVLMTNGAAASSTLNVNGTGAKAIYDGGNAAATGSWGAGQLVGFLYDGAYWHILWVKTPSSTGNIIDRTLAAQVTVYNHSSNNVNYPLVWNDTGVALYRTTSKLYFNPSTGLLQATKVGVIGGTSAGFMKADGTVDSTTYQEQSVTLADNAESSTLPAAGTATAVVVLLQSIRDNLKSLFAKLTDGSVTKVGTATVGSTSKPIYLNAGTPAALSATVGSASVPTYYNAGQPTACTNLSLATSGNAATATKLATARTVALSGDVGATGSFDGSANLSLSATLANSGVTAGTYTKVTVDAKGRATAGASAGVADVAGLQTALDAKQNTLTFDTAPTDGSTNPVTSNGVFNALRQCDKIIASGSVYFGGGDRWWDGPYIRVPLAQSYPSEQMIFRVRSGFSGVTADSPYTATVFVSIQDQEGIISYRVRILEQSFDSERIVYRYNADATYAGVTLGFFVPAYSTLQWDLLWVRGNGEYGTIGAWYDDATYRATYTVVRAMQTTTTPPAASDDTSVANTAWVNSRAVPTVITSSATLPAGAPIGKSCILESDTAYPNTVYIPSGETLQRAGSNYNITGSFPTAYSGAWFTKVTSTKWRLINYT